MKQLVAYNMNPEIQLQFNSCLEDILKSLKEFAGITAEQKQLAISILLGFMENLQAGRLPFRDLEKYHSKEIFEQIPAFRKALEEFFQFQRPMKVEEKRDFVTATTDCLNSHPADSDSAKTQKTGSLLWLELVLDQLVVASGQGGEVNITLSEKNEVVVNITGDLAVQYSARQFLASFYPNPKDAPVITRPDPSQTITYTFNQNIVKAARREHHQLVLLKELLATQGYTIEIPGKKDCQTQLFVDAKAIDERDENKTIEQWGITLDVADALKNHPGNVVFPFTAHLTVKKEAQREQFKQYFTQVGILNFDKTAPKQFILNDMGEESLECNISLPNAKALWDYFLRLDTMAATQELAAESIRGEDQLAKLQQQTRSKALRSINEIVNPKGGSPYSADFFEQTPTFGIAGEYSEDAYQETFEKLVNQSCVRGPAAFHLMMDKPSNYSSLAVTTGRLAAAIETANRTENDEKSVSFAEAYQQEVTSGNMPCVAYAEFKDGFDKPFANTLSEYLVGLGQQITPKLLPNTPLTGDRIQTLKDKSKGDLSQKLQAIETFFNVHSPYFFVKTIADKIETLLDSPNVTEEAIEKILTEYGVTDLEQYKIKGMSVFNIYHIKFSLLEIAFNACIKNGILFSLDAIKSNPEGRAWVTNPSTGCTIHQNRDWVNATEWNLNKVYPIGWVSGKREIDTTASRYARQGSASDTAKSTYVAGRSNYTSSMFVPPTGGTTRNTGESEARYNNMSS
jgi:hypothetical protein